MADVERKSESLGQQEFGSKHILWLRLPNGISEFCEAEVKVFGFGRKEEGGFEYISGVVGHKTVGYIEAFYILDCSRLVRL